MSQILAYADEKGHVTSLTLNDAPQHAVSVLSDVFGSILAYADAAGRVYAEWDESRHERGKTTPGSRGGSFAPSFSLSVTTDPGIEVQGERVGSEFHRMAKDVPGFSAFLKMPGSRLPTVEIKDITNIKDEDDAFGVYSFHSITLAGRSSGLLSVKDYAAPGLLGNFRHEMGHWLFNEASDLGLLRRRDIIQLMDSQSKEYWVKTVSRYAATNSEELFCEGFSKYSGPRYKKGDLPKDLEKLYGRILQSVAKFSSYSIRRPLYVSRPVENADEIIAWAKSVGFSTTLPAEDMHVTICYSKEPVDWLPLEHWADTLEVPPEGVRTLAFSNDYADRTVAALGSDGAVVLRFESAPLSARHQYFLDRGASWDYDAYHPHVTLTYEAPDGLDLSTMEPYTGQIVLGPEEFTEVEEDWVEGVKEHAVDDGGEEGVWRTVRGRKVFIREGEDLDTALKRSLEGKGLSGEGKETGVVKALTRVEAKRLSDARTIATLKKEGYAEEQIQGLRDYAKNYYDPINGYLWGDYPGDKSGTILGDFDKEDTLRRIQVLDKAFKNPRAKLAQDMVVFRGVRLKLTEIGKFERAVKAGKTVTMSNKGFMSTSLVVGRNPMGWLPKHGELKLELVARKGARAIFLGAASPMKGDREVLFPRGSRIRVTGIRDDGTFTGEII